MSLMAVKCFLRPHASAPSFRFPFSIVYLVVCFEKHNDIYARFHVIYICGGACDCSTIYVYLYIKYVHCTSTILYVCLCPVITTESVFFMNVAIPLRNLFPFYAFFFSFLVSLIAIGYLSHTEKWLFTFLFSSVVQVLLSVGCWRS